MSDFVQAARPLSGATLDAPRLPLEHRVEILADTLALAILAGRALPPTAPPSTAPPPGPAADRWPGLGSFETVWSAGSPLQPSTPEPMVLSDLVLDVHRWMWAGLSAHESGDAQAALTWWAGGWLQWSEAALVALHALHHAGLRFRTVPRSRPSPMRPEVTRLDTGPTAGNLLSQPAPTPPAPEPGVLGVRFEPLGVGVLVREVHPRGPAAAVLHPGDVVLSAGTRSLVDIDPDELKRHLVVPAGRPLRCEVYRDGEMFDVELIPVAPETLSML